MKFKHAIFLGIFSIGVCLYLTKPVAKVNPDYRKDIDYEFIYSDSEFQAIEDSVKKENKIWTK